MTIADPLTYTLQVTVKAEQIIKLRDLATKSNFASVEEFLVAHALGVKSSYNPPADVVSSIPTGSIEQPTDEPETESKNKSNKGKG